MLFNEFHRRRGLSEFSKITPAKYFDLAFVIILLHMWHYCVDRERSRFVRDLHHVRSRLWRMVLAPISRVIHGVGVFLGRVLVATGACLFNLELKTESYCSHRYIYLVSLLDKNREYLNETIHNQFCSFFEKIFLPFLSYISQFLI